MMYGVVTSEKLVTLIGKKRNENYTALSRSRLRRDVEMKSICERYNGHSCQCGCDIVHVPWNSVSFSSFWRDSFPGQWMA